MAEIKDIGRWQTAERARHERSVYACLRAFALASEIAAYTQLCVVTVRRHLARLEASGAVSSERVGRYRRYRATPHTRSNA